VCLKPNKQTVRSTRTSFNFLVNRLDEEVSLSLANNAEITAEDIYEVLVGACADGTLCRSARNSLVETVSTTASTQNSGRRNS